MSDTDWEFNEDGSCMFSQYDSYEFRTDVVLLNKKQLSEFLKDAKKHSNENGDSERSDIVEQLVGKDNYERML